MAEILSLREAVRRFVHDGDSVALEGFTHLIPTAAGHELIRQGRKDLTLIRMTPDLVYDLLIGAGCAKKLVFSWGGNPGVGSLHRLRDAVEKGWPQPLEIEEHSHADLANAYVAGASGLPLRGAARLRRLRPAEGQPADPQRHLPVHRRSAGGGALGASGRQRDPRAEGRPQGQRAALGHPRRAEGSGPGGEALHRHRRGDRRRTGRPDERLRPAELGAQRRVPGARRRASVLCPRLLRARQPLLPGLGPDRPRPRKLHRVDRRIHPGTEDFGAFQAKLAEGKR